MISHGRIVENGHAVRPDSLELRPGGYGRRAQAVLVTVAMVTMAGCASRAAPRDSGQCQVSRGYLSHGEYQFYDDWGDKRYMRLRSCRDMCDFHLCTFRDKIPHRNLTVVAVCRPFVSCSALPAAGDAPDPRDLRDRELPP